MGNSAAGIWRRNPWDDGTEGTPAAAGDGGGAAEEQDGLEREIEGLGRVKRVWSGRKRRPTVAARGGPHLDGEERVAVAIGFGGAVAEVRRGAVEAARCGGG